MTGAEVALVAVAGLACGTVNSLAGGGSLILFPAMVATGMGTLAANVTNSTAAWPGYFGGLFGFREELRAQRPRLPPLVGVAAAGSALGAAVLLVTPDAAFERIVPALVAGAALLLAFQPVIARRAGAPPESSRRHAGIRMGAVFAGSIYGGYFGAGLGVILLGVLALTVPEPLRRLNGLKTALSVVVSTTNVAIFAVFGPVRWWAVAVAAPMALVGGYLGARLARRIDERVLRAVIVVFGLAMAVYLALR